MLYLELILLVSLFAFIFFAASPSGWLYKETEKKKPLESVPLSLLLAVAYEKVVYAADWLTSLNWARHFGYCLEPLRTVWP